MKEKVKVEVLKWSQQLSSSAHNVDTFERLVDSSFLSHLAKLVALDTLLQEIEVGQVF